MSAAHAFPRLADLHARRAVYVADHRAGLSPEQIAELHGVNIATVDKALDERAADIHARVRKLAERPGRATQSRNGAPTPRRNPIPMRRRTADAVLLDVVDAYGVCRQDVLGESRLSHIVEARHAWWWLLWDQGWSYCAIGRLVGRHHTSVRDGVLGLNRVRVSGGAV